MKNAVCPLEFEALARRNKKEWLLEFSPRKARKPRKVVWFVPPCSRRSRCSRFIEFKRSVRCNPNRESFYGLFFLVRTLRVVRGSRNSNGVSVAIFTAKAAKSLSGLVSLFVQFAVHRIRVWEERPNVKEGSLLLSLFEPWKLGSPS